ncbi:DNA polymerase, partial [Curtobacterium sp. Csp2]|uniref:DNA polymerase n=1 Tax=Curtobacterium sp. Csp2 TaxID=2495430 RepID=UPI003F8D32BA
QLPRTVRSAVVADEGWTFVVADAAQLEPRVLAAMSGDRAMAAAGDGRDLYDGVVASGAVETRQQAKGAMLGAMYGATQGDGGRLVPRLARAFPAALGLVDRAARAGERGEPVTTLLGRTSPVPDAAAAAARARAWSVDGTPAQQRAVESRARSWGRFTRNFVVQGTAAEWALAWMGSLRTRLPALPRPGRPVDQSERRRERPRQPGHEPAAVALRGAVHRTEHRALRLLPGLDRARGHHAVVQVAAVARRRHRPVAGHRREDPRLELRRVGDHERPALVRDDRGPDRPREL